MYKLCQEREQKLPQATTPVSVIFRATRNCGNEQSGTPFVNRTVTPIHICDARQIVQAKACSTSRETKCNASRKYLPGPLDRII